MIGLVWFLALICGFLVAFVRYPGVIERGKPCYMRKLVHPAVLRFIYWGVIPFSLLITIIMYCRIYHRISKMLKFKNAGKRKSVIRALITIIRTKYDGTTSEMCKTRSRQMKEIRMTILMFITVFFFVLCWFPGIVALFMLVNDPKKVTSYFRTGVFLLYSLNSALNPFLYAFHISRLKQRLREIWNRVKCEGETRQEGEDKSITFSASKAVVAVTPQKKKPSRVCFNDFDLQF